MTRAEELTLKLADGIITLEEMNELEWLVAGDGQEATRHLVLLDVEALFRSQRQDMDISRRVVERLAKGETAGRSEQVLEALDDVLPELAAAPTGAPQGLDADRVASALDATGSAAWEHSAHGSQLQHQKQRRRRRRRGTPAMLYVLFFVVCALVAIIYFVQTDRAKRIMGQAQQPTSARPVSAASAAATQSEPEAPRPVSRVEWRDVTLLRGTGSDRTLRFEIGSGQWKVVYKVDLTESTDRPFVLRAVPSVAPDTAQRIGQIDELLADRSNLGEVMAPYGPGEYYLQVTAPDAAAWDLQVMQTLPKSTDAIAEPNAD